MWGRRLCAAAAAALLIEVLYRRWRRSTFKTVDKLITFDSQPVFCKFDSEKCNEPLCAYHNIARLCAYLESAQISADFCLYSLSYDDLAESIIKIHKRGVNVRVILDYDMIYNCGSHAHYLRRHGVDIRTKALSSLMHHKFCLIDSQSRTDQLIAKNKSLSSKRVQNQLLINGSFNWTQQATYRNWEHIMITSYPPHIALFQNEFDRLWPQFEPLHKLV